MPGRKGRSVAVIGLGAFGRTVALELARAGDHVLGIDQEEGHVARLADDLAEAIIADGRDEEALRQAGVADYDVGVVAIGENLEANIICTMNLKLLGVPCIWVKATSRTHHRILVRLGADRVVLPEHEVGQQVAQVLHNPQVRDYVNLENYFQIVNYEAPEALAGRRLAELKLGERFDLRALGVMRGTEFLPPEDGPELRAEDKLLLLGRRANLRRFTDSL